MTKQRQWDALYQQASHKIRQWQQAHKKTCVWQQDHIEIVLDSYRYREHQQAMELTCRRFNQANLCWRNGRYYRLLVLTGHDTGSRRLPIDDSFSPRQTFFVAGLIFAARRYAVE